MRATCTTAVVHNDGRCSTARTTAPHPPAGRSVTISTVLAGTPKTRMAKRVIESETNDHPNVTGTRM
jgi:hypothetical protein